MAALVNALTGCGMALDGDQLQHRWRHAHGGHIPTTTVAVPPRACILQISQVLDVYVDLLRTPYRPQAVAAGGGGCIPLVLWRLCGRRPRRVRLMLRVLLLRLRTVPSS